MEIECEYDKIYRYCYFRLRSRETAEDVTQETFLRYLEHRQYHSSGKTLQCLYTIAHNLCTDHFRKRQTVELPEEIPDTFPEEQLLSGMAVRRALAAFPEETQELLLLRYSNGVPISTLAKLTGLSRFAVRRRLLAASAKLKTALEKEGIYE